LRILAPTLQPVIEKEKSLEPSSKDQIAFTHLTQID